MKIRKFKAQIMNQGNQVIISSINKEISEDQGIDIAFTE